MQSYLPPEGIHSVDLMNNVPFELHFNGIRLRIVRVSRVCDNTIPWIIPYHAHENFEFHYVSGGKGYIDIENSGFEVVKGDFFITAPYVRHRQSSHATSIMEEFCIECMIDYPENIPEDESTAEELRRFRILSARSLFTHFTCTDKMMGTLYEIENMFRADGQGHGLMIKLLLLEVLIASLSIASSLYETEKRTEVTDMDSLRIFRIKNYIDSNICNPINIQTASKAFYISPRQLDRILQKRFGMSFHQYLTRLRVKTALQMLQQDDMRIEDVARGAGFTSYQQMYRVLKRFGYDSPKKLRGEKNGESAEE